MKNYRLFLLYIKHSKDDNRMKFLLLTAIALTMFTLSCDETDSLFGNDDPDPLINRGVAEARDYNLTTPVYGMQVSIREDVGLGVNTILDILDNRAEQFLNCQLEGGSQLGFEDVMLSNGDTIGPLSDLRVFVVPNRFECEAADRSVCSGIYFFGNDIIVVSSSRRFSGCPNLPIWKHEVGHRYGMAADHSNLGEFSSCTDENNCSFEDVFGL